MASQVRGQHTKQRGQQREDRQVWELQVQILPFWTRTQGEREKGKGKETEDVGRGQIKRSLESQPYKLELNCLWICGLQGNARHLPCSVGTKRELFNLQMLSLCEFLFLYLTYNGSNMLVRGTQTQFILVKECCVLAAIVGL